MRYGPHSVEDYASEHLYDERVADAQKAIANLDSRSWRPQPDETPIEFRRRVEQAYDEVDDPRRSEEADRAERQGFKEGWIDGNARDLEAARNREIADQPNIHLKEGGQVAKVAEIERFREDAYAGKNADLEADLTDLTSQQAARQEYLSNHVVGPAREAKVKELGLENVHEPEPPKQLVVPQDGANDQHIPHDVMEKASQRREAASGADDKQARIREAYNLAGTPSSSEEASQLHSPGHER